MFMKKRVFIIIAILVLVVFGGCFAAYVYIQNNDPVKKMLREAVVEVNKLAPIDLDEAVSISGAALLPNKVFQYKCTMKKVGKDEISAGMIEHYILPDIVADIKKEPAFVYFKENGISLCYSFFDKNGKKICDLSISPDEWR